MKKTHIVILCLAVLNLLILIPLFQIGEEEKATEKRVEEKVSAVTFEGDKQIPQVEDYVTRRLREVGLDGGSFAVETSLQQ